MNFVQIMAIFKKFDLATVGLLKNFSERAQASGDTVEYVKKALIYLEDREGKIPTVVVVQKTNTPLIKR